MPPYGGIFCFLTTFPTAYQLIIERRNNMLGFADGWITLVYLLCIGSTLLCVVYGLINWNRGAQEEQEQVLEELDWEQKDISIDTLK